MLSSDSSSDDEERLAQIIKSSNKDFLTILHPGKPPLEPQPFDLNIGKKLDFPTNLWESGTLIYSKGRPDLCLPPATDPNDKILRFFSRFESGNLNRAFDLGNNSYHLDLEYDPNNTESCQWFYFQMKNVRKKTKYKFYISGFHKISSVERGALKVFWYSEIRARKEGISWSRGGYNYDYGVTQRSPDGKRSSLQFNIIFPYDNDTVYMCYSLPYTYSDLQRYISQWQTKNPQIFSSKIFCKTLGERDCPMLTIASPGSDKRDYLLFTARVHPGESNGSVVLHGLIDFLLSEHPAAKYIINNYIVKIIPMLNIDGVVEGFYRIGLSGVDLNRVWTDPDPKLHPVIFATKEYIKQTLKKNKIAVYIDFHGHSRLNGSFAFGCPNTDDPILAKSERVLPRIISFLTDAFSWGSCQFSIPKKRKDASRIVIRKELGIVQSFTIETSFGGIISGPRTGFLYDEIIWKELGAKCGESVYHLLIQEKSPLTSYVLNELGVINPAKTNNHSKVEIEAVQNKQHYSPPANRQNENNDCSNKELISNNNNNSLENQMDYVQNSCISKNDFFHVVMPQTHLHIDFNTISTTPPDHFEPKWSQIQFSKR